MGGQARAFANYLYPVGGGSGTSFRPEDHARESDPLRSLVPYELGGIADGEPGVRPAERQEQIGYLFDVARTPNRQRPMIPVPYVSAFDPMTAQRPPTFVDTAGGLPLVSATPPAGSFAVVGSPAEAWVTLV